MDISVSWSFKLDQKSLDHARCVAQDLCHLADFPAVRSDDVGVEKLRLAEAEGSGCRQRSLSDFGWLTSVKSSKLSCVRLPRRRMGRPTKQLAPDARYLPVTFTPIRVASVMTSA